MRQPLRRPRVRLLQTLCQPCISPPLVASPSLCSVLRLVRVFPITSRPACRTSPGAPSISLRRARRLLEQGSFRDEVHLVWQDRSILSGPDAAAHVDIN
jgi:hypothetical protein